MEAAGFNFRQDRLSWTEGEHEYAFFLDEDGSHAAFLEQAPPSIRAALVSARGRRNVTERRFRAAVGIYALITTLPLLLLLAFVLNVGILAEWLADRIPVEQEARIGQMVLAQTRARTRLIERGPALDAVKLIGERLTAGSRYRYQWFVAQDSEVNAFAAPGGVVVVNAGLIAKAARPEELAGVLAHEVSHVERRHSMQGLVKKAGLSLLLSLALGDFGGSSIAGLASTLTELKFSRDAEAEADSEGVKRLASAGIDPKGMSDFFAKLAKDENGKGPALLATHPAPAERMARIQRQITTLPATTPAPLPLDWRGVQASLESR
ncbi:Peptidase family M48 [Noviherbaspirillum humi]|uniref:Peptidase family M48 n=1 Tax=Noviherbaspirillum humi TaxID=1688639 RepID=A0A239K4V9_9BURK|nr:M48 family metallopeptidase [Noviherbaspirillum humi]SNT12669.1 Peptidase family M48 [Noviherbaspirillum humi]